MPNIVVKLSLLPKRSERASSIMTDSPIPGQSGVSKTTMRMGNHQIRESLSMYTFGRSGETGNLHCGLGMFDFIRQSWSPEVSPSRSELRGRQRFGQR